MAASDAQLDLFPPDAHFPDWIRDDAETDADSIWGKRYFIVKADSLRLLEEAVNDNIDASMTAVGGPFKFFDDVMELPRWGQAMVRTAVRYNNQH